MASGIVLSPLWLLKQWMITGEGKKRTVESIASEIGIPATRLDRALKSEDPIHEFLMAILAFLVKNDVQQAADLLRTCDISAHPARFIPAQSLLIGRATPTMRAEMKTLQDRLLKRLPVQNVFCQIVEKKISIAACRASQAPEDCFGCSAPSRLCRVCMLRPVAAGEIDLCGACYHQERNAEDIASLNGEPPTHLFAGVKCLIEKMAISQTTCREKQGPACGSCRADSRLCSHCGERRSYYPEYQGTCLACTVLQFDITIADCEPHNDYEKELLEQIRASTRPESLATPIDAHQQTPPAVAEVQAEPDPITETSEHVETEESPEEVDMTKTPESQTAGQYAEVPAPEPVIEHASVADEQVSAPIPTPANTDIAISRETLETELVAHLRRKGFIESTAHVYMRHARNFIAELETAHIPLSNITLEQLDGFINSRNTAGKQRSTGDINQRRIGLKHFLDWLTERYGMNMPMMMRQKPSHTADEDEQKSETNEEETVGETASSQVECTASEETDSTRVCEDDVFTQLITDAEFRKESVLARALKRAQTRRQFEHASAT